MLSRLFKFFVLALLFYAAYSWLFSREQRKTVREWASTLALAFLVSSTLMLVLYLLGVRGL